MNKNDSEKIAGLFEELNLTAGTSPETSDIVILNSCSIRDKAERRVSGKLQELHHHRLKTSMPKYLGLAGCMPQHEQKAIFDKLPFLDIVIGTNTIQQLPNLLLQLEQGESHVFAIQDNKTSEDIAATVQLPQKRHSHEQAWVSIMYGCDNFCSYCIVPYTRGREISRPKQDILDEIHKLPPQTYATVVLLGQNVNSYGKKLYSNYDFSDLLIDIHAIAEIPKIEFLTSHPKDISEKLIRTIASLDKVSREIHFPIQAGDNEILYRMNRGYTVEDYKEKVTMIRSIIPNAKISTDVIVGYPGETEAQFEALLQLINDIGFFRVNTAAFSPRPQTQAAQEPNQISVHEKAKRLKRLMDVVDLVS